MEHQCTLVAFLYEVGYLKRLQRAGWNVAGISQPIESVAEHSFRTAIIASTLAAAEGADPARAALLGLYHDVPETRTGDVPHLGRNYVTTAEPNRVIKDQTADLANGVGEMIRDAVAEFEAYQTPEAVCAHDADKLECLLQAREYQSVGAGGIDAWITSSERSLRTETARRLAGDAKTTPPGVWWRKAQA